MANGFIFPFILVILIGTSIKTSNGLRCYACSFSSIDTDQSCLIINDSTYNVECSVSYCTIIRQEYIDPSGVISSFLRGCQENPDYLNHELVDSTFRTYYRACTSDLCNIGDGIQSVTGGNLSPTPPQNGANLLVPGTGSSTNKAAIVHMAVILVCVLITVILY